MLGLAVLVEDGAAPGVEERVVLECDSGRLNRIEGGTARGKDAPADIGRRVQPTVVGLFVADPPAGAAVQG